MAKLRHASRQALSIKQAFEHAGLLHQQGRLSQAAELYVQILEVKPDHRDALRLLGWLRYQQGEFADALRLLAGALRSDARSADTLSNYGAVLDGLGRRDEALESYDRALSIQPGHLDSLLNKANTLTAIGRHDDALAAYESVIALAPGHVDAMQGRGNIYQLLGRYRQALESYDRALELKSVNVSVLSNRANALLMLDRPDEALASCARALVENPRHLGALINRAKALLAVGRAEEALRTSNRALEIVGDHVIVLNLRGKVLQTLSRYEEAISDYDRALAIEPNDADSLSNRGHALNELGRHHEALVSLDQAVSIKPDHADARNNRGVVLQNLGRPADALADYEQALALAPDHPEASINKGNALLSLGCYREALANDEDIIARRPDYAQAHFHAAHVQLSLGNYQDGWKEYEWRWGSRQLRAQRREFAQPLWLGQEALHGKTILLHAEQGLGDTIQFMRYVPLIAYRGAKVILEVQPPLLTLAKHLKGVSQIMVRGEPLPDFDVHCPLLSLPLAFDTELDTIPQGPYLHAPEAHVEKWRGRLTNLGRPAVGLVWSGSAAHANDRHRSIALKRLLGLLAHKNIAFVSLQRELRDEDSDILTTYPQVLRLGEEVTDFADTAAIISLLDLVVSVDTSVAHLAGAMGARAWLLLPFVPDFRWMLEREDTPWYSTARLFRQPALGDWTSVVRRVSAELAGLAALGKSEGLGLPVHRHDAAARHAVVG